MIMKLTKINIKFVIIVITLGLISTSCKDYLNVVPDNIPTVEQAFANRNEAEGFLFGCYSFLPLHARGRANPALYGGDEVWLIDQIYDYEPLLWGIAKGEQGTNAPLANYWSSQQDDTDTQGGKTLFTGISDCNIFLENIDKPFDLEDSERDQWIAEIKFIKAYLHFWLFRMYGPIPLIKENLPISASSEEVQVYREPVDDVVDYIVSLLDEASDQLPLQILDITNDMGRPTRPMALALKAQVLTLAASPLFNGNTDYAGLVDDRGVTLFPQEYKAEKWQKAVDALKEAIDVCHEAGHGLFDYHNTIYAQTLSESTIQAMQVRGAVTERWNSEIIWGDSNSDPDMLERLCHPTFYAPQAGGNILQCYAPPLRIVEQFYSKNGVPIEEDKDWEGIDWFGLREGDEEHKYYIEKGYETINLHFNREARFYGAIAFDGGTYYGNGQPTDDDDLLVTVLRYGYGNGAFVTDRHSSTGYLVKKLVHYLTSVPETSDDINTYRYAFPVIRLADLYLMYAEALNEVKASPDDEVYEYIDKVRERSGLKGVVESWTNYSNQPDKPKTQEGMREIIQRERMNELAFEGARFWDLRRWKLTEQYMNQPIRGLDIYEEEAEGFYQEQDVYDLTFEKKDYLWPIKQSELLKNRNLVQNPGW